MIDYGQEHNLIWVTAIDDTGEIWCAPNPEIRMQANWSMGRGKGLAVAASKEALRQQVAENEAAQSGLYHDALAYSGQSRRGAKHVLDKDTGRPAHRKLDA